MKYYRDIVIVALSLGWTGAAYGAATSYAVDPAESIFAVVTHKAGVAAQFAHNHLIAPETYTCSIERPGNGEEELAFSLSFPVTALAVDLPKLQKKWYPAIKALDILETPFTEIDESDRATIKEHMLAENQLDAEQFPEIQAELVSTSAEGSTVGEKAFPSTVTIRFSVHGKTVERAVPASIDLTANTLQVEAVGRFRFTEFGFEPYSALFGAVKNKDEFDVYVHIQANAEDASASVEQ